MVEDHSPPTRAETPAEYYEVYKDYANTLRAWFITLGAGGPTFLVTTPSLLIALKAQNKLGIVLFFFIAGITCQVFLVLLNKIAAWYNYSDFELPVHKKRGVSWIADVISEQYWIDLVGDVFTSVVFTMAIWKILSVI